MPKFTEFTSHDDAKVMINGKTVVGLIERRAAADGEHGLTRVICLGQGTFDVVGVIEDVAAMLESKT